MEEFAEGEGSPCSRGQDQVRCLPAMLRQVLSTLGSQEVEALKGGDQRSKGEHRDLQVRGLRQRPLLSRGAAEA